MSYKKPNKAFVYIYLNSLRLIALKIPIFYIDQKEY